jgi:hypothetical protein
MIRGLHKSRKSGLNFNRLERIIFLGWIAVRPSRPRTVQPTHSCLPHLRQTLIAVSVVDPAELTSVKMLLQRLGRGMQADFGCLRRAEFSANGVVRKPPTAPSVARRVPPARSGGCRRSNFSAVVGKGPRRSLCTNASNERHCQFFALGRTVACVVLGLIDNHATQAESDALWTA